MTTVICSNPFEEYPEFVKLDNRAHRTKNPITMEVLRNKHRSILPPDFVAGKKILDLGCCIGASGLWALYHGAEHYTGVEVQKEYAETAGKLLAPFGSKANIVNAPIELFLDGLLAKNLHQQYDIVLGLAVLHVTLDYYQILKSISLVCRECIIIENLIPKQQVANSNYSACSVEYCNDITINLAGKELRSLSGPGVRMSAGALDIMMSSLGFSDSQITTPAPVENSIDVYSDKDTDESRYIRRYTKGSALTTLCDDLKGDKIGEKIPWKQTNSTWKFDKCVAHNFGHIARDNIPNYETVIEKCVKVALKKFGTSARVIDVGSAIGFTLRRLYESGFHRLVGIDNSQDMLEASWTADGVSLVNASDFPESLGKFDVVIANWVLHFVEDREQYIRSVYRQLEEGGIFILSEKVMASELATSLYYDFKLDNGLSEEEIALKAKSLKNVLVTQSISWYFQFLESVGFKNIEIIDASFSFATIMAVKQSAQ